VTNNAVVSLAVANHEGVLLRGPRNVRFPRSGEPYDPPRRRLTLTASKGLTNGRIALGLRRHLAWPFPPQWALLHLDDRWRSDVDGRPTLPAKSTFTRWRQLPDKLKVDRPRATEGAWQFLLLPLQARPQVQSLDHQPDRVSRLFHETFSFLVQHLDQRSKVQSLASVRVDPVTI
jgi:hypothetical protein